MSSMVGDNLYQIYKNGEILMDNKLIFLSVIYTSIQTADIHKYIYKICYTYLTIVLQGEHLSPSLVKKSPF